MVDDHELVRAAVSDFLDRHADLSVVGQANTGADALVQQAALQPDLVLMDINMPGISPFDAAKKMKAQQPSLHIVFLSGYFNDQYIEQALDANATGYLTKTESPDVLVNAIRKAVQGESCFSPEVSERMIDESRGDRRQGRTRFSMLSPRELEVLGYIAQGLAKKDIASELQISVKTVENHSNSLMTKLSIHDRVKLTRFAIREGLVEA